MKKNLLTLTIAATILFGGTHTQAQESTYTRLREFAAHIAAFNKNCPQEKDLLILYISQDSTLISRQCS